MSGLRNDDRLGQRIRHYFPFLMLLIILMGFLGVGVYVISREGEPRAAGLPEPQVVVRQAPASATQLVVSYHDAVTRASPAVVNIFTTQKVQASPSLEMLDDPVFRRFFGNPQGERGPDASEQATSLGSGVIVSPDGYILTNNHVVARAEEIVVALLDGRRADARVIGTDPDTDLAVIKISNMNKLPTITLRDTPTQVGDVVLAIGNPFGVGQTVTQGIVSATGRTGLGINTYEDFIQTDAAINPGNSGGALTDSAGHLIGINTAIYSRSGGNMGIGFAIPTLLAQKVMQDIIKNGSVIRGWLGIQVGPSSPADVVHPEKQAAGVQVEGVLPRGPAARGGLEAGDRITRINQTPITSASQLMTTIAGIAPGQKISVEIIRNGQPRQLKVEVEARPKNSNSAVRGYPSPEE